MLAVIGGLRITSGTMTLGEVTAFIQYSRQFTQPLTRRGGGCLRVVEQGTHAELLERRGAYHRLATAGCPETPAPV